MSVEGQEGEVKEVATGLPQGSPVSPVLFAIYMADIHKEVEEQTEEHQGTTGRRGMLGCRGIPGCRGISFVDDTWVVKGGGLLGLVLKMEECAKRTLRWAEGNAVRFETSKTEAILLTKSKNKGGSKGGGQFRWESEGCVCKRGHKMARGVVGLSAHPCGKSTAMHQPGQAGGSQDPQAGAKTESPRHQQGTYKPPSSKASCCVRLSSPGGEGMQEAWEASP